MQRNILLFVLVLVLVAVAGMIIYPLYFGPAGASITSISTDKDLYHSKEVMKIVISLGVQGEMGNATLQLQGMQDKHGGYQLMHEIPVTLSPGPHTIMYDHHLPACSSCSGLAAGTYLIDAYLMQNGIVISNLSHSIRLEQ